MKRAVMLVLALAACRSAPPRKPAPTAATSPEECASCHAEIATQWRASYHRVAFTDATFQESLAMEAPKDHPFCTGCHAPAAAKNDGVDCLSCHRAPHRGPKREPREEASSSCATCHEFTFEGGRTELVQKTLSEHAASDHAGVSCVECHMRDHRDHRFVSGHSPSAVGRAVHVSGALRDGSIVMSIRADVGHAFPTGDMFRRARLVVFGEDPTGRIVWDAERLFARTWGGRTWGGGGRTETADTRIRGTWSETFPVDVPIARLRWSLVYERAIAVRGPHVTLASSDEIASGSVSAD